MSGSDTGLTRGEVDVEREVDMTGDEVPKSMLAAVVLASGGTVRVTHEHFKQARAEELRAVASDDGVTTYTHPTD